VILDLLCENDFENNLHIMQKDNVNENNIELNSGKFLFMQLLKRKCNLINVENSKLSKFYHNIPIINKLLTIVVSIVQFYSIFNS
jgi:hypothetical protein